MSRVGVRFRACPECSRESAYPINKSTCCLARGVRRKTEQPISLTPDELRDIVRREIAADREAREATAPQDATTFADGATVLLSDIHIPLHQVKATHAVIKFCQENRASGWLKRLVLAGDVFDGTLLSRFLKQHREEGHGGDLGQEIAEGREIIHDLVECFDESYYILGNHEARLDRVIAQNPGIPAEPLDMAAMFAFYEYPAQLRYHRERKLVFGRGDEGSVTVIHGEKYNKHRAAGLLEENLYKNTVQGHTHRPQTFWYKGRFGHVNGYLHDPERQGYMPDPTWTLGFTVFEHWDNGRKVNPYFVRITDDGSFALNGKVYRG